MLSMQPHDVGDRNLVDVFDEARLHVE